MLMFIIYLLLYYIYALNNTATIHYMYVIFTSHYYIFILYVLYIFIYNELLWAMLIVLGPQGEQDRTDIDTESDKQHNHGCASD